MHSLMISSDVRPRSRSVFSCILRMTRSWFSEPPLTPMRTGLPWSTATLQIVENCSSRRLPGADVAGIDAVLVERRGARRVLRQQDVAVVVEVADERRRAARQQQPPLERRHGLGRLRQVHRDAQHLGPGLPQFEALLQGRVDIGGVGVAHRLHDDGRAAADVDAADVDAGRLVTLPRCHDGVILPERSVSDIIIGTRDSGLAHVDSAARGSRLAQGKPGPNIRRAWRHR